MGRERKLQSHILSVGILISVICASGCSRLEERCGNVTISFHCTDPETRSALPDEDLITDISLMIFDESGYAEDCLWLGNGTRSCISRLVVDKRYTFCACANFGYQIYADHIDELQEIKYYLAYPDEYREGIPMYAEEELMVTGDETIEIGLRRLMAKISLSMDRSRLDDDVEMKVRAVKIGNCPRSVTPFRESRTLSGDDSFPTGFSLDEFQTAGLNSKAGNGISKEVSLYMFENLQGDSERHIDSDRGKVFDKEDVRTELCSYIEMEMEYISEEKKSGEKGLIYRFYLGEDHSNFDIRRNTHYHITVTPENDGISEDSWRVDISDLTDIGPGYFQAYPSDYIRGDIGDKIHIWCEFSPVSAPFDVGISYMDDDKAEGIYDYVIDEDGRGAVLTLTGPGRGLIYMEAGDPVNDAALFIIEVNQP